MITTGDVPVKREELIFHAFRAGRDARARLGCLIDAVGQPLEETHAEPRFKRLEASKGGRVIDAHCL